jgi:O-antigen/teichoic acid export membrane protein
VNAQQGKLIAPASVSGLTSGRLLARNTLLTIVGEVTPLALGLIAVPILVRRLGVDRYGVLTLSYLAVGYLWLFDLGLGRAATQQISDALGAGNRESIPAIFWTSMMLLFILGVCAGVIVAAASHWFAYDILNIPAPMRAESVGVFLALATSLPFVLSGSCSGGALSAFQRFDLTTAIGAATGVYSFASPLVVLAFTHNLVWIVAVLVIGRLGAWAVSLTLCLRIVPGLAANIRPSRKVIQPLMCFGGWLTVSGITSPLMVSVDRIVMGSMLSIAAVSYYTVPYQIVNKLSILPGAMGSVLFPAFSTTTRADSIRAAFLFERASRYAVLALFPGMLLLFLFSREILTIFFGSDFASHGSVVMRWLLIGVLMNGLAQIPYGFVQGANRPDLTAKFHVAEAPIYFLALFLLLPRFGVAGAAIAWSIRVSLDAAALFGAVAILLPATSTAIGRITCLAAIASVVVVGGATMPELENRIIYMAVILGFYAFVGWYWLLDSGERVMILHQINSFWFKAMVSDEAT